MEKVTEYSLNTYQRKAKTKNYFFYWPYSYVVVKVRNIRASKVATTHTDKIKALHEDCVNIQQCPKVRHAFPFKSESYPIDDDFFTEIITDTNDINNISSSPAKVRNCDISKGNQASFATHVLPQPRYTQVSVILSIARFTSYNT